MKHILFTLALLPLAACSGEDTSVPETPAVGGGAGTPASESGSPEEALEGAVEGAQEKVGEVTEKAGEVVQQAETLLTEVQSFLDAGNVEKAQLAVGKLDALRDQLPDEWTGKIDQVKGAVDALLAAKDAQLPSSLEDVKLPGGG